MDYITTKYKCPFDGSLLFFNRGEDNNAYICSYCSTIYPTLSKHETEILKDIESFAISKLEKYKKRLDEIKKEENSIIKIFEFTEKSGLLSKLNKANLSAGEKETKVVNINNYKSKEQKEAEDRFYHLSDHLFPSNSNEKDPNPDKNA